MIIFLYGEDSFRGHYKIKELKKSFSEKLKTGEDSISFLDGADLDTSKIREAVSSSSLFSSGNKRMIIIENSFLNPNLDEILNYFLENKESYDNNTVIFWEKKIKGKKGVGKKILMIDSSGREVLLTKKREKWFKYLNKQNYVQEFPLLSNTDLLKWTKDRFIKEDLNINNNALQLLVAIVGSDLWQLDREINKLVNYKKGAIARDLGSSEIEPSEIKDMVRGVFDENIFALTDALSSQNKSLAIKLLEQQYDSGINEYYLLNMMVRQIKIMLQIKQSLDSGESPRKMASSLRLHPFIVQKGVSQVGRFSLENLKKALNNLVEIDFCLKTGKGEAKTMLDLFVLKI